MTIVYNITAHVIGVEKNGSEIVLISTCASDRHSLIDLPWVSSIRNFSIQWDSIAPKLVKPVSIIASLLLCPFFIRLWIEVLAPVPCTCEKGQRSHE